MISTEQVTEWPGSKIIGEGTAVRMLYRVDSVSLERILRATDSLFEWVNPQLPEDLHFLRADGSTVMGSIAQEDYVWLMLSEAEMNAVLRAAPPELRSALTW